jgi:hypothetical protein
MPRGNEVTKMPLPPEPTKQFKIFDLKKMAKDRDANITTVNRLIQVRVELPKRPAMSTLHGTTGFGSVRSYWHCDLLLPAARHSSLACI